MSIAELIMQGTEQNTKSTAWVSDSLQKLGQQVGTALKEKEQQRQAQAMMPFLQQNMQESLKLAQEGKSGEAYSKMFSVMNPQTMNNPQLANVLPFYFKGVTDALDNSLKDKQINMMQGMYNQRYGGEGTGVPDIKTIVDNLNKGKDPKDTIDITYDQPQGVPAMTEKTGMAVGAPQPFPFAAVRQASPTVQNLPINKGDPALQQSKGVPVKGGDQPIVWDTPSEMRLPSKGPVQAQPTQPQERYKPPEKSIQGYLDFANKFDKLSSVKRATVVDNQSIIFPDQKEANDFVNKPSQDKAIFPVNPVTAIGTPGLVAIQMPKEYEKWIESTVNVNKNNDISYSLKKEAQNKPEAEFAMRWLQDWQKASIRVSADPTLRNLIDNADGDILKVNVTQVDRSPTKEEIIIDPNIKKVKENLASIQGKSGEKVNLTDDQRSDILMLRNATGAAQQNKAKFIRVDQPSKKSSEGKPQDFMVTMNAQFGQPKQIKQTPPQPTSKSEETIQPDNPFYEQIAKQKSLITENQKQSSKKQLENDIVNLETKIRVLEGIAKRGEKRPDATVLATDYVNAKKELEKLKSQLSK